MRALPMILGAALLAGAHAAQAYAPGTARVLRDKATLLYRSGQIEQACDLFRKGAEADPRAAAAWADLGACAVKAGDDETAVKASLRAVALGDRKMRRNAYFNLAAARGGHRFDPDAPSLGASSEWKPSAENENLSCAEVPSDLESCVEPARVCVLREEGLGAGGKGWRAFVNAEACRAGRCGPLPEAPRTSDGPTCGASEWGFCQYAESLPSGEGRQRVCTLVAVDPCRRRAGLVCATGEGDEFDLVARLRGDRGAGRFTVSEIALPPAGR